MYSRERQVVLGTMLGGSSCVRYGRAKHHLISMRGKDDIWLTYKSQELRRFGSETPITCEDNGYLRWHSFSVPCFDEVRAMFYDGSGRRIDPGVWDELRDIAWAIWLGDCGEVAEDGIKLRVGVHGAAANDCQGYFRELGMECDLIGKGRAARLVFGVPASYRFLGICGHQIPRFMANRYTKALGESQNE